MTALLVGVLGATGSGITNSGTPAVRVVLVGFAVALAAVVVACYLLYRRDRA
jgi:hypothetical protein